LPRSFDWSPLAPRPDCENRMTMGGGQPLDATAGSLEPPPPSSVDPPATQTAAR
jgi:hypothetical protein